MQLPTPQLSDALTICPELKQPLKEHLMNFTEGQRTHIPVAIQDLILGTSLQHPPPNPILPPPIPTMETTTEEKVYFYLYLIIEIRN